VEAKKSASPLAALAAAWEALTVCRFVIVVVIAARRRLVRLFQLARSRSETRKL